MTFKKLIIGIVATALAFTLATGATAATKKKSTKKSTTKKTTVVKTSESKKVVEGPNVFGRTGLIWAETAQAPAKGIFGGAVHMFLTSSSTTFETMGYKSETTSTVIDVPVGCYYGVAENIEIGASIDFLSLSNSTKITPTPPAGFDDNGDDSLSGLNSLTFGGKYIIKGQNAPVDFGVGVDISIGPMSDDFGDSATDFSPRAMVTYQKDALLLNGNLGFVVTGAEGADDYIQLGAGAGLALSPKLTGMVELGINTFSKENGVFGVGIRTAGKTKLQALLGIGLGEGASDIVIGAGVGF